jgi:F0F1-type ATP synthase assembly protein I
MAADHAHNGEVPLDSDASAASSEISSSPANGTSDRVAARTRETMQSLKMSSVGIEFALSVVIGMFAGRWLDGRVGTQPWLMLVGVIIGFAAGLRSLVRAMDRAGKRVDQADARKERGS